MEKIIITAIEEMKEEKFQSISDIKKVYSIEEILDIWLSYEGIHGYTRKIINVLNTIQQ